MPSTRPVSQPSLALIVTATILLAVPFHIRPDNFTVDDGYFYPQIARFIASGHGSTFNGIMPTNGYHPLWMLVCVVGAWITPASGPLLQLLTTIQDMLTLFCVILLVKIAVAAKKRGGILGCAPILFFSMVLGSWRLQEANLALALQLAVLTLVVPIFPGLQGRLAQWRIPLIGVLLGFTLLARLDLIFFVGVVLTYELLHRDPMLKGSSRLLNLTLESVIVGALLAPYLGWNLIRFHHLEPISGAIKSSFPHVHQWYIASYIFPVVGAILLNGSLLLKRERTSFDTVCLLTAAAAALHLVYTLSFGVVSPWYFTTGYLSLSLSFIWVTDRLLALKPSLVWIEGAFGILLFTTFLFIGSLRLFSNFTYTRLVTGQVSFHGSYSESKHALADKLRETLPAGSRIFVFDAPGGIAYYSGMDILPADGLVADYAYNTDLAKEGFVRYAAEKHIDYFITPYLQPDQKFDCNLYFSSKRTSAGQLMHINTPLTHLSAGSITLSDADLLFRFREVNPNLESTLPEVGVWRIPH